MKKFFIAYPLTLACAFFIMSGEAHALTATYTTAGSHQWTAPAGVTSVTVELWGGGGAGGNGDGGVGGGNGGGGAAYSKKINYPVTPGNSYTVYVGAGGSAQCQNGTDSYFVNASTVLAVGGGACGGAGLASLSIGDVKYSGGSGGSGWAAGGGGGGSAGSGGNGTSGYSGGDTYTCEDFGGSGGPGGLGVSGNGGDGGNDNLSGQNIGQNGVQPGGGGGGGAGYCEGGGSFGSGADGQAILTYTQSFVYQRNQIFGGFFRIMGGMLRIR